MDCDSVIDSGSEMLNPLCHVTLLNVLIVQMLMVVVSVLNRCLSISRTSSYGL